MVVFGASAIMTLACQGCVQTGTTYVVSGPSAHVYEVQAALPTTETPESRDTTRLEFSGVFEQTEAVPQLRFELPESFEGSTDLLNVSTFGARRLYASTTMTEIAADREQDTLSPVPRDTRRMVAEVSLSAPSEQTGLAFDVGVAPRVSFSRDGAIATRRIGGEVRIGQNFDKRGESDPSSGWYLFAGADGEALVWEPGEESALSASSMALRDKVTVGDIQAGVSFNRGPGQVSLSYIRREVEYRERNLGASENEDFAGISFTVRR